MAYPANDLVLEIGQIGIKGNIVPDHWYQSLVFENGKPNFVAVTLLSEIFYWYRPKIEKDELTGLLKPIQKKFKADFLQRNTKQFAAKFGFSDKQTRDALRFLEKYGLIKRHSRTITTENGLVMSNVQFIELIPKALIKLQKIDTYGLPGPTPQPHKSKGLDLQGGTYTENTSKTSTKKDIVLTVPPSQQKKKEAAPFSKSLDRFVNKLTPDQRKIHDRIVKYTPHYGLAPLSDDVCAWFLSKKYTVKQVTDAFMVYQQDEEEARLRGRSVNNMGGAMVTAIKNLRNPKNVAFEANKQIAIASCSGVKGMRVLEKYVSYRYENDEITIEFNLPSGTFTSQVSDAKRKLQYQMEYA